MYAISKDQIDMLISYGKNTTLFYILMLVGWTPDAIRSILELDSFEVVRILDELWKKKFITPMEDTFILKDTYMERLEKAWKEWKNHTKMILWFYAKLKGITMRSDKSELYVQRRVNKWLTNDMFLAIWRNHHSKFCNGWWDRWWVWNLMYLCRESTDRSQPIENSTSRPMDIPVSQKDLDLLNELIVKIPELKFIKNLAVSYESIKPKETVVDNEEILNKQIEIKRALGLC